MSDGRGCTCAARSDSECGCGADWTPAEVIRLRAENAELQKIIDLSKKQMDKLEVENKKYRSVIKICYILISTFNKRYKDRKMLRTERIEEILK
jgi:DNA-binding XRE family transcriptional regulator